MLNSIIRTPALMLTVPLFALIAASYPAHAEIYKWRDNRGVVQYSDRPPVTNFTKITRNEMVNALQTKDLCTVGPIVKSSPLKVASNQNVGAFFSKIISSSIAAQANNINMLRASATTTSSTSNVSKVSTTSSVTTSPITTRVASTSVATSSTGIKSIASLSRNTSFISGGKQVTVLGFSVKPIKTVAPAPTIPTSTAPTTAPVVTAPVVTAPAIPDKPPVNVAITNPAPNTPTAPTTNTSANLIQVGLMPTVDISKNMKPLLGTSVPQVSATTAQPGAGNSFRIVCNPSHMSNDDPLVYPGQQGAAHHHIFYGNTSINYKSDLSNLTSVGNSTCAGGTLNRSAYWTPTLIDTATNTPVLPDFSIFYYKKNVNSALVAPPKGLRMLSGNSKATSESEGQGQFICYNSRVWNGWKRNMSSCEAGDTLFMTIEFPSCWDGKNLDSPNHKDHMSRPVGDMCPTTHPVAIPVIIFNLEYKITQTNQNAKWRLASDNYSSNLPGGYSMHGDWVNGWDETTISGIVKNCINAGKDAGAHLLCDGRTLF